MAAARRAGAAGLVQRGREGVTGPASSAASKAARAALAVDGEDHALEPRAGVEVPADLLHLDPRRLLEREAADARAEGDEREAARPERVRARERARRWRGG